MTAICEKIVEKGNKERWTFRFKNKPSETCLKIGIVDDQSAQTFKGNLMILLDYIYWIIFMVYR